MICDRKLIGSLSTTSLILIGLAAPKTLTAQTIESSGRIETQLLAQVINNPPSPIQRPAPQPLETQPLPSIPELINPQNSPVDDEPPSSTNGEETLTVKAFRILGNTVFAQEEFEQITNPYVGQALTFQDLLNIRSQITDFYVSQGYITSGAFIPADQDLSQAIVTIQVVEGQLDEIQVVGNQRLRRNYIRDRISRGAKGPLNINKLLKQLQTFQLNPLIENISAELATSDIPGFNVLIVTVTEADTRDITLNLNNQRSANVGRFQRQISFRDRNLFGIGDQGSLSYANTDGSNELNIDYQIPINAQDGTVNVGYSQTWTQIITTPFKEFDPEGNARTFSAGYRQPIIASPTQELALGLSIDRRESDTKLLENPFPLSAGSDDEGRTRITGANFTQEWIKRNPKQIFALRSDIGLGLNIAATQNQNAPDGRFFHWRGQAQWIKQLARHSSVLVRSNLQLADRALPSLEQFGLGGVNSVRGYPTDFLLSDNGLSTGAEAKLPIFMTKNRDGILQIIPFIDYGYAWNWNNREIVGSNHAVSGGIGLSWQWSDRIKAQVHWGVPFIATAGQDAGIDASQVYFSINTKLY